MPGCWGGAGGSPVGGGGPAGRRAAGLVQPAVRRAGQYPRRVVLGAGRRRAGGGKGTGGPAGPVVDRDRPVQRSGQFLTTAAGVPAAAAPGIRARVLLGAAWSAYHLGDHRRAAPLAADGVTCARQAGEPQLKARGRNLLAGLAWAAGDADRVVAEIEASRGLSGQADPALAARAQVLLANAAFLSGDLARQDLHGRRAIELARMAAGQEGLALALNAWALSAVFGAGIQPATMAALDEAVNVLAAHPDRFAETIVRALRALLFATLGQLDAAETEVGLCWAAGRSGAVRLMKSHGPLAEARLVAARGDTAAAVGALRRSADGGRRVGIVWMVPTALAALACMAAIAGDESTAAAAVGEARAELGGRRQAVTAAALGYAEGIMAWRRGELADAERMVREATVQWHLVGTARNPDLWDFCGAHRRPPAVMIRVLLLGLRARGRVLAGARVPPLR